MKFWSLLLFATVLTSSVSAQKTKLINSRELIERGIQLNDSGQYKEAIAVYNQVDRNDTNYVWSLYEKAVSCTSDSQYNEAIKYCEEGLALRSEREHEAELFNQYGNVLNDAGQSQKALIVFDSAIKKYPSFSLLYFNKGIVYVTMDRYKEAEELFKQTLMINPFMYSAHFYLGISALQQGKIVQSYLSFIGYLLVSPEGKYSSRTIKILDAIANAKDEILEYKNKRTTTQDDNYSLVEEVVLAKIALEKEYKPLLNLDDPISRQIQVIFEKLEWKEEDTDFWSQYYLPFYKKAFNENKFEFFVNWIFENVKIKSIQDFNKKNKKELEAFVSEISSYFNLIRSTRQLQYSKREGETNRYLYDQGKLLGKGKLSEDGKSLVGSWIFYFPEGNLKATGEYNSEGKREGYWSYNYYSGALKATENYKNGKLEGEAVNYYENGLISSKQFFVQDQNEGNYSSYYHNGAPYVSINYKNGKVEGEKREYYNNGSISKISHFSGSQLEGPSTSYYKSGGIKEKSNFQKDVMDGEYQYFDENGTLTMEGAAVKGKSEGEWRYYYESGKLKSKCVYKNDKRDGNQVEYYETGELKAIYPYERGNLTGEAVFYDKDQKIYCKLVYSKDILQSSTYFDKSGKQINSSQRKNNMISLDVYNSEGYKTSHQNFDAKGNMTGICTYYYPSGKISETDEYRDGKMNGLAISYYRNGQKKTEVNMADGKENGYYTGFYLNGQKQLEGWYRDGEAEGHWFSYDELGNVDVKTYYIDGELWGYKEEFSPNGKATFTGKYSNDWLESLSQFDTSGKILITNTFPRGEGKYILLYQNGNKMIESHFTYGDFDGPYKSYYFDGSVETAQFFKKGLLDSTYKSYFFGGKLNTAGRFLGGKKTGEWKYFDENGNLNNQVVYSYDRMQGPSTYFFENGKKDIEINYKNDQRNGSTVRLDPDGSVAYAVRYDSDVPKAYNYQDMKGGFVPEIPISSDSCQFKSYFPNGKMARQCTIVDSRLSGVDILYYPSGQVRYRDSTVFGMDEGPRLEYFPNGKIKKDYFYLHDNSHGICKEFNENGTIQKEFAFWNGTRHGTSKYFNGNGQLQQTRIYYYGKLLSVKNEK